MAHKCALIVDDSRTARQVLGEALCANQLRVETAASAEEALEYLSRNRPDVIFMDHMMPGMDGFQAVRAIKTNPATATIPIMMYTSQEGELYVGQARALGAVGVLPKQVKSVEVSEVLRSLHLIGGARMEPALFMPPAESPPSPAESATPTSRQQDLPRTTARDQAELQYLLEQMLDDHRREIRLEVEAAVSRVLREQAVVDQAVSATKGMPLRSLLTGLLVLALVVLTALFFRRELDAQNGWRSAVAQNASLLAELRSRAAQPAAIGDTAAAVGDPRGFTGFMAALEWGINQSAVYPPGGEPFDDARLQLLQGLLERLTALGFTGTVGLDSHVGDFCYVAGADDALALAPDDLPADRCQRIGLPPDEARLLSAGESLLFANFLASRVGETGVRVDLAPHGDVAPVASYPPDPQGVTAGEWNRIARQNNRVTVTLLTDNGSS